MMTAKPSNPVFSAIGWMALALGDIVLAGLLLFGILFLVYPYNLPLSNQDLREVPVLATGEVIAVTATNPWYRQPITSPVEFFQASSAGVVNSQEYVLYRDEAGDLYVALIEVCPFFARYRVAFNARQEVPEGTEVSLEFYKPVIRFDTVTVRGGSQVVVSNAEGGLIDWRLCGLVAIGLVAIVLLAVEYRIALALRNRRRAA